MVSKAYRSDDEWRVEFAVEFQPELEELSTDVRKALSAQIRVLQRRGPAAGRPQVDTLGGSKHANMKELRFSADNGVWRVAFAFDPRRHAMLLVAGDKSGVAQKQFYKALIARADERYDAHLQRLEESKDG